MKLNLIIKSIILILTFFFLNSCDWFDLTGVVSSSDVENRFNERDELKNYYPPNIPDTNNFSFIVISDPHYQSTQPGYIKEIDDNKTAWNTSFIVVDGDITQNGLQEAYNLADNDFTSTTLPIYPVIGNHDLYNDGFEIYKKLFGRTFYDIKIGNILHFIVLDTANGTIGQTQKTWLESTLKGTECKYKIVFSHYSPTDKEWETGTSTSYPEDAYYLFDTLEKYGVDYCICGHLHYYDYKEIRGVKYIIVSNTASANNAHLKMTITNGELSESIF
jgi:3',5'-cyclic AMP phosphodiesterase CpdA